MTLPAKPTVAQRHVGFQAPAIEFDPIAHYLKNGLNAIDGWGIDQFLARVFLAIDGFQQLNGVAGNLFEIGVHHGRAAVLLALMARNREWTVMIDLFERQDENIDQSGHGSREILEQNLERWAKGRPTEIVQANSLELAFASVPGLRAGVRFAHIDGGHYREVVLNDLRKTEAVLVDGGVVVMDDFEHSGFPEVNLACNEYLQGDTRLAPVAVGHNKLILTTRDAQARLAGFLSRYGIHRELLGGGETPFHGYDVVRLIPCAPAPGLSSRPGAARDTLVAPAESPQPLMRSMACRYEHFTESWYKHWAFRIGIEPIEVTPDAPISYRKAWEWAAILQALHERGMLQPGKRAMGFAVGQEPLTSMFASMGVEVLASDLGEGDQIGGWAATGQHAASLQALMHLNHVDEQTFRERVSFQPVDMNHIGHLPRGTFDFVWSSCAIEHLGTLERGLDFVRNAMRLLKPGGVAVHTTEFNVSSDDETITEGDNCLYRRKDLEALDRRLRLDRCGLEQFDFDAGAHEYDLDYDVPPYFRAGKTHIKLQVGDFICTSFLVIARKA